MTPVELFDFRLATHQWVHGSDVGVDENGQLWVRADANLHPHLGTYVSSLTAKEPTRHFREYSILTHDKHTGLNPRCRSEPIWKEVNFLKAKEIGSEWIAVR